jgi:prepilin-type N-terminal cleavage/methylation domain-containing protein
MNTIRTGMTLIELLIVMIIIGIVYSIGMFTVAKNKIIPTAITLDNLQKNLAALDHEGKITLSCNLQSDECTLETNKETITGIHLNTKGKITRYGFNREGELYPLGPIITHINGKTELSAFSYALNADRIASWLLLKQNDMYYLYTPLYGDKPFITTDEDSVKNMLYNETIYPIKSDSYYAAQ